EAGIGTLHPGWCLVRPRDFAVICEGPAGESTPRTCFLVLNAAALLRIPGQGVGDRMAGMTVDGDGGAVLMAPGRAHGRSAQRVMTAGTSVAEVGDVLQWNLQGKQTAPPRLNVGSGGKGGDGGSSGRLRSSAGPSPQSVTFRGVLLQTSFAYDDMAFGGGPHEGSARRPKLRLRVRDVAGPHFVDVYVDPSQLRLPPELVVGCLATFSQCLRYLSRKLNLYCKAAADAVVTVQALPVEIAIPPPERGTPFRPASAALPGWASLVGERTQPTNRHTHGGLFLGTAKGRRPQRCAPNIRIRVAGTVSAL
ncbi:hypothetical protein CYMTET_17537, partial [Cymbomonas tetramitiformis]